MKHIIWKPYWNHESEEVWLNEMSSKGFALLDYSWCRYVFEDAPKGEYTYRIELLENSPSHPESCAYINFLAETGIEYVAKYMRWVYFRRKSSEGEFDLFSDAESRIAHYKRIIRLWVIVMAMNVFAVLINFINVTEHFIETGSIKNSGISGLVLLNVFFVILFLWMISAYTSKIRKLKREMLVHE
ncbi:MAG: DUF2812 domain-containing protein [Clostridiales bacterium]|nr:DUF2812 domain-containing protein [Clostridiales bacterium]